MRPRASSYRESSLRSAQAMKSVQLFPNIVQEPFCPNIPLLHWHSARAHDHVGKSCLLVSLESGEAKNTEEFFSTYFLWLARLQKSKARLSSFFDKAHHIITDEELRSVSYISFGRSLPQILQFWLFTDSDRENLYSSEKIILSRYPHHFLVTFDKYWAKLFLLVLWSAVSDVAICSL